MPAGSAGKLAHFGDHGAAALRIDAEAAPVRAFGLDPLDAPKVRECRRDPRRRRGEDEADGIVLLRHRLEFAGGAVGDDPAAVDDDRAGADGVHLLEDVG